MKIKNTLNQAYEKFFTRFFQNLKNKQKRKEKKKHAEIILFSLREYLYSKNGFIKSYNVIVNYVFFRTNVKKKKK